MKKKNKIILLLVTSLLALGYLTERAVTRADRIKRQTRSSLLTNNRFPFSMSTKYDPQLEEQFYVSYYSTFEGFSPYDNDNNIPPILPDTPLPAGFAFLIKQTHGVKLLLAVIETAEGQITSNELQTAADQLLANDRTTIQGHELQDSELREFFRPYKFHL